MKNSHMKRQIEFSMRRVPRLGRGWRYIPLPELPLGTEIVIETTDKSTPGQLEPRDLNHLEKIDPTEGNIEYEAERLSEGVYRLWIGNVASATLEHPSGVTEDVRPLNRLLAPSSTFQFNVDRTKIDRNHPDDPWTTTWRCETGAISRVFIPGTRFTLTLSDGEVRRQPQRRHSRRGRQYTPLRSRRS